MPPCFGCGKTGHQVKDCSIKSVCAKCGEMHHTSTHDLVTRIRARGQSSKRKFIPNTKKNAEEANLTEESEYEEYMEMAAESYTTLVQESHHSEGAFDLDDELEIDHLIEAAKRI